MKKKFSSQKGFEILPGLNKLARRAGSLCLAAAMVLTCRPLPLNAAGEETEESVLECPLAVHEHDESCYQKVLVCENTEKEHTHGENCYEEQRTCGLADFAVHTHQPDYCWDREGNLICPLPEIKEHVHGPECYQSHAELTCGQSEGKDHTHDASCYTQVYQLICGREEIPVHTHNESCYDQAGFRICGLDEIEVHEHDASCMKAAEKVEQPEDDSNENSGKEQSEKQDDPSDSDADSETGPEEDEGNNEENRQDDPSESDSENKENSPSSDADSADNSESAGKSENEEEKASDDSGLQPADEQENSSLTEKAELSAQASPYRASLLADGTEVRIDKFDVKLVSGAAPDAAGNLAIWTPSNPSSGHQFIYRADYAISGTYDMGGIQITLPLHIFKDRDGNWADQFDCPYLTPDAAPANADFVYETNPENNTVTIYSRQKISAGLQGYIEFSYSTVRPTTAYADMEPSQTVQASISGTGTDQENAKVDAAGIPAAINTNVSAAYTQKQANPVYYSSWQSAWGTAPEDADEFYYLVWTVRTVMNTATAPYTITLDDPFDALGGSIVGYRFAGTQSYSEKGTSQPLQTLTDRYDYVLVRYSKEQADALIRDKNRYDITNRINVTVTPADGKDPESTVAGSASWSYSAPVYVVPSGNFWAQKSGIYGNGQTVTSSSNVSSYNLSGLMEKQTPIENLQFSEYVESYPYPWTADGELTGTEADADKYGKKNVDYLLEDRTMLLEKTPLQSADYDITSIQWQATMRDAVYSSDLKQFIPAPIQYTDTDQITFEVYDSNGTARTAAVYDMKTRSYTQTDGSLVTSCKGQTISLAAGAKGFAMKTSNAHYYTRLSANPSVTLYPTDHVTKDILGSIYDPAQYTKAELTNQMSGTLMQDGSVLKTKGASASDFIQASVRTSGMSKTMTGASNDKIARQYRVSWRIAMSEMVQDQNGTSPVEQSGGIFYDLLPAGAILDASSISVYDGNTVIDPGNYAVSVTENYKNSGRTMVKAAITQPAVQGYSMRLSTLHSWNALQDYGKNLLNSAAYETGNADIGSGLSDDGGNLTEKDLMSGLDPDSDGARKFLYAQSAYTVSLLMASQTGLMKQVRGENDSAYSESSFISNNGTYSYLLRTSNDASTRTTGIIFFDSLENVHKPDGTAKNSDWHGTLQGIDTSQIVKMGADPKIYISTQEDLNINDHHDLNDTAIWQEYTDQNLADVKAVAADASKTAEGEDFILPAGQSLTLTLFMKAPANDPGNSEDPTAYNNVYAQSQIVSGDPAVPGEAALYNQGSTQIHFRTAADVSFRKVSTQDESEPVQGAVYELSGTSAYGSAVSERKTTNSQGEITFDTVEKGTYTLREVGTTPDWLLDTDLYTVSVNADATVSVNGQQTDGAYILKDRPRVHADLQFSKTNSITGASVEGAQFKLSGTSDYGTNVLQYSDSNTTGSVQFNNIEQGTYALTETSTPEGYVPSQTEWQFVINEMGQVQLFEKGEDGLKPVSQPESGGYVISNEPLHTISFVKSSTYGTGVYLEGAEFHLYGISDLGTQVDMTAQSQSPDNFGLVTFNGLEPGVYSLQETKAPTDKNNTKYILDDTVRTVRVLSDGSFTISGLSSASINNVEMPDWRNSPEAGTVTITKEWQDDLTDKQRNQIANIPDITITTSPPYENPNGYTLTFNANGGTFSDGSDTRSLVYTPAGNLLAGQNYEIPARTNMKFGGWKNAAGKAVSFDLNGNCSVPLTGDAVLTAVWNEPYLAAGANFSRRIPSGIQEIVLDRGNVPASLEMKKLTSVSAFSDQYAVDVTSAQNGLAAAWIDGNVLHISTVDASLPLIFNADSNYMFERTGASAIEFDGIDTSRVTGMIGMFRNSKVSSLDLSGFNTQKVTRMDYMFDHAGSLASVDLSSFDTSNVTNMGYMFRSCSNLNSIDVSSFNTSKVTAMESMFENLSKITSINIDNFDTSKVRTMWWMFANDRALKTLHLNNFSLESATDTHTMFYYCTSLTELTMGNWNAPNLVTAYDMFRGCGRLKTLDLSTFHTPSLVNMANMFDTCSSLTDIDVSGMQTEKVKNMSYIFSMCTSLKHVDLSGFRTPSATIIAGIFYGCSSLQDADLSSFDTGEVTNMSYLFYRCSRLSDVNLTGFNTSKVTNMGYMFNDCTSLTDLDVSSFDTSSVTNMSNMFSGMSKIISLQLKNFNTSNVKDMSGMFQYDRALQNIDVSSFDISKTVNLSYMFTYCQSLNTLDMSSFEPAAAQQLQRMFVNCSQLTTIYANDWISAMTVSGNFNGSTMFQADDHLSGKSASGQVTLFSSANTDYRMCTPEGGYFTDPKWKP